MCQVAKLVVKAEVVAAVVLVLATLPLPVMTIENLCTAGVTRQVRLAFTFYSLKYATVSIRTLV